MALRTCRQYRQSYRHYTNMWIMFAKINIRFVNFKPHPAELIN